MKTCSKCKIEKALDLFFKDKSKKLGVTSYCKTCSFESRKSWAEKNENHLRSYMHSYYQDNSEVIKKRSAAHALANPVDRTEYRANYHQKNKAKRNAQISKWKKQNRELLQTYKARRRAKERGTLTDYDLSVSAEYRKAIANDPCFYCGTTEAEAFHIDHYFPIAKGGDDRWWNLVRACESCNLTKNAKCGTAFMLMT